MKFCTSCGASLEDKALFCTKCGAPMKEGSTKDSAPTQAPVCTKEKKQPSCIFVKLLSIFISFILCVILIATACIGIVRSTLDPDSIVDAFTSVEAEDIEEIKITNEKGKEVSISKYILDYCDEDVKKKYDLDEDKVMKVIKDTNADEFLAEVIADYSAYFIKGEELRVLDAERVITWIRDNEQAIEDVVEYEFKEADYKELEAELNRSDIIRSLSAEEIEDELDVDMSQFYLSISVGAYIVLIVICCVLAALVVVINRNKIRALFTYITVCLAVVGAFYLVIYGCGCIALAVLLPQIVEAILSSFLFAVLIRGVVMFGVGFIASIVYKIVSDRRRAKA